jgi:hypothetical protein
MRPSSPREVVNWTSNPSAFGDDLTAVGKQTSEEPHLESLSTVWTLKTYTHLSHANSARDALYPSRFSGRGLHDLDGNPNGSGERKRPRGETDRWTRRHRAPAKEVGDPPIAP